MTQRQATEVRNLAKSVYEAIPIIAKKAGKKWEWEPKWNELAYLDGEIVSIRQHWLTSDKRKVCRVAGRNEKSFTVMEEKLIPLLHWEKLEEILEGFGWFLWDMKRTVPSSDGTGSLVVVELAKGELVKCGRGKDRQEAFQRAVIELEGKER